MSIALVGGRKLRQTLKAAGVDVHKLTGANKEAATIAAGATKSTVPRRSGDLARTIRAGATTRAGVVRVGNNKTVPYANPIEWGWPRRGITASHFAANAAKRSEPVWTDVYTRRVHDILDTIKGK